MPERAAAPPDAPQSDIFTTIAVAIAAYALDDLVHEVAGHGSAVLLVPGARAISLSTVALQTTGDSRIVAAAGSIANLVAGFAALWLFRRSARFSATEYFFWLFGSLNLLNGSGYPLYSAVLGSGDWEFVVRGMEPAWLWRVGLGVVGAAAYGGAIMFSARELARSVERNLVARTEIARFVLVAYVAGGVLFVVASAQNPIGASLILVSGVSSGFGAMAGLMLVPNLVEKRTAGIGAGQGAVSRSAAWIVAGLLSGVIFVTIFGPGIQF